MREKDGNKVWLKDATLGRAEKFGTVAASVAKIASGLTKIGFGPKDVICMYCSNYVEYWLITLAGWSCGGCVMPVNCELESDQLRLQLIEAEAKILVCDDFNVDDAVNILENTDIIQHVVVVGKEGKGRGCIPVQDLMEDDGKSQPKKPLGINLETDAVYMPFSSSSNEKGAMGVMHTHR